jgi:hypothetical protein
MANKRETVEEFLARGGKINVVPAAGLQPENKPTVTSTAYHPPQIMDLNEGALYFAEPNRTKKTTKVSKVKPKKVVDESLLPERLRKYL